MWACVDGSFKGYPRDPDHAIDCSLCQKKRRNARYDQNFAAHDQGQVRSEILGQAPEKPAKALGLAGMLPSCSDISPN
jgi:hypothetical protein